MMWFFLILLVSFLSARGELLGYRVTGSIYEKVNTVYICTAVDQCQSTDGLLNLYYNVLRVGSEDQKRWFIREVETQNYVYGSIEFSENPWQMKPWKRIVDTNRDLHEYETNMNIEKIHNNCDIYGSRLDQNIANTAEDYKILPLADQIWFLVNQTNSNISNAEVSTILDDFDVVTVTTPPPTELEKCISIAYKHVEIFDTHSEWRLQNEYQLLQLILCDYMTLTRQVNIALHCYEKVLYNENTNVSYKVPTAILDSMNKLSDDMNKQDTLQQQNSIQTMNTTVAIINNNFHSFFNIPTITKMNKKVVRSYQFSNMVLHKSFWDCNLHTVGIQFEQSSPTDIRMFCHYFGGHIRMALFTLIQQFNPLRTIQILNTISDNIHTLSTLQEIDDIYLLPEYANMKVMEIYAHCMMGRCSNYFLTYKRKENCVTLQNRQSYIAKTSAKQLLRNEHGQLKSKSNMHYELSPQAVIVFSKYILRYIKANTVMNPHFYSLFIHVYKCFRQLEQRADKANREKSNFMIIMVERDDVIATWQGIVAPLLLIGQYEYAALNNRDIMEHICSSRYGHNNKFYDYKYYNTEEQTVYLTGHLTNATIKNNYQPLSHTLIESIATNISNTQRDSRWIYNFTHIWNHFITNHTEIGYYLTDIPLKQCYFTCKYFDITADLTVENVKMPPKINQLYQQLITKHSVAIENVTTAGFEQNNVPYTISTLPLRDKLFNVSIIRAALVFWDMYADMIGHQNYFQELTTDSDYFGIFLKTLFEITNPSFMLEKHEKKEDIIFKLQQLVVLKTIQLEVVTTMLSRCKEQSEKPALSYAQTPQHCALLEVQNSVSNNGLKHMMEINLMIERVMANEEAVEALGVDQEMENATVMATLLNSIYDITERFVELVALGNPKLPWTFIPKSHSEHTEHTEHTVGTAGDRLKIGLVVSLGNITEKQSEELMLVAHGIDQNFYDVHIIVLNNTMLSVSKKGGAKSTAAATSKATTPPVSSDEVVQKDDQESTQEESAEENVIPLPATNTLPVKPLIPLTLTQQLEANRTLQLLDIVKDKKKLITVPRNLKFAVNRIRNRDFDIIATHEAFNDSFLTYLTMFRLAPAQVLFGGSHDLYEDSTNRGGSLLNGMYKSVDYVTSSKKFTAQHYISPERRAAAYRAEIEWKMCENELLYTPELFFVVHDFVTILAIELEKMEDYVMKVLKQGKLGVKWNGFEL